MDDIRRWKPNSLPRKGWILEDVIDEEDVVAECEWCSTAIRFVHFISHPEIEDPSAVGCVCCEHLTDDYVHPRQREKQLRSFAQSKTSWLRSPRWKQSAKGNLYRRDKQIVIFEDQGAWKLRIREEWGRLHYPSIEQAKIAALRYLTLKA